MYLFLIIAILILLFIDYRQTLDIKNHPGYYEINIILGKHPSDFKITVYFIICAIIFTAVTLLISSLWQFIWAAIWAAVEAWAIHNNYKLNLKI